MSQDSVGYTGKAAPGLSLSGNPWGRRGESQSKPERVEITARTEEEVCKLADLHKGLVEERGKQAKE